MPIRNALLWTLFWVVSSIVFGVGVYYVKGLEAATQFASVYIVEKLLSFDNLFVFLLIFNHFNVPNKDRRKVLNYGIAGAIILRAVFIGFGVAVVSNFAWVLYILGVVLFYSAWGVAFSGEDEGVEDSKIINFAKAFSVKPLFVWIVAIELSDIVFAIDSIPAALSISQDMFIIFSANICAILGLRSLFFVIQYLYDYIPQLKYGIALILAFIGAKMLLPLIDIHVESALSLLIVVFILVMNVAIILVNQRVRELVADQTGDDQ